MTTKTRRGMRRRKRMEFRLVLAAVFCLLLVASFGKLRLQQRHPKKNRWLKRSRSFHRLTAP